MKKLWKWIKRQFGMDKEFIAEMDAMVSRSETMFLDKIEGMKITHENLLIVDMLANHSFSQEVRARAKLIMRTGEIIGMDRFSELQKQMSAEDVKRKQKILKALEQGQCGQHELRIRLGLDQTNDDATGDHCLSLCMELAKEGKVVEEADRWRLADQTQSQTAH